MIVYLLYPCPHAWPLDKKNLIKLKGNALFATLTRKDMVLDTASASIKEKKQHISRSHRLS